MKIKNLKFCLYLLVTLTLFISCEKDDDEGGTVPFVEEDRTEQQAKDKDSLLAYLSTHYYNSSYFETGTNHKYTDIVITELEEGEEVPDGHTLLSLAVETRNTVYFDVNYEYYVLNLNQGGGDAPRFTDRIRVRYEGTNVLSGDVFDSTITPTEFDLQSDGFNRAVFVKAWPLIFPTFNSSENFVLNVDGTVSYQDFGLGVMFIPSGLAYFSQTNTGASYANLIFKFELLQTEIVDSDNDGIPSYAEDRDLSLDVFDDDTDGDEIPNFIDQDDDGDEVSTFNELEQTIYTVDTNNGEEEPVLGSNEYEYSRSTSSGVITITTVKALDTNNNGMLDYLDETVSINYNDTSN